MDEVEFSWVLESNHLSKRTLERGGALVTGGGQPVERLEQAGAGGIHRLLFQPAIGADRIDQHHLGRIGPGHPLGNRLGHGIPQRLGRIGGQRHPRGRLGVTSLELG